MFIRVWSENNFYEKHLYAEPFTMEEAVKYAKALLAAGYKKAWIEIQEE